MATKKSTNYIEFELEWLENQLLEIKEYCDKNKISEMEDRQVGKRIAATIEQQIASKRNSLQDYLKMLEAVDKLREKEASKKMMTRGDQELGPLEAGKL